MGSRGIPGFHERSSSFFPGAFIGRRQWRIRDPIDPQLCAVNYPVEWVSGVNEARCLGSPKYRTGCISTHLGSEHKESCILPPRPVMETDCGCGFWAYTEGDESWFTGPGSFALASTIYVSGIIVGYGKMVIGPKGFRCERAKVAALLFPIRRANLYSYMGSHEHDWPGRNDFADTEDRLSLTYPQASVFYSADEMYEKWPLSDLRSLLEDQPAGEDTENNPTADSL